MKEIIDISRWAPSWGNFQIARYTLVDAGLACQTFCLAAEAKGVGTVIMGVIDDESISNMKHLNYQLSYL
jgi:nitroreductase